MITVESLPKGWRRCHGCGDENLQLVKVMFTPPGGSSYSFQLCGGCCQEMSGRIGEADGLFDDVPTEGWAYPEPRARASKLHYFVRSESLCKRYKQNLVMFETKTISSSECCANCISQVNRR